MEFALHSVGFGAFTLFYNNYIHSSKDLCKSMGQCYNANMQLLNQYIHTSLHQTAKKFINLTRELYKILPPNFTGQCHICNADDAQITILVESSVLANHLHYYRSDIKKHFSNYLNRQITQISLKVKPKQATFKVKSASQPSISSYSAQQIDSLADTISDNSLKQSLKKLANKP